MRVIEFTGTHTVNPCTASDAGILGLKAAGYSDDDIIEITEAAALGPGLPNVSPDAK